MADSNACSTIEICVSPLQASDSKDRTSRIHALTIVITDSSMHLGASGCLSHFHKPLRTVHAADPSMRLSCSSNVQCECANWKTAQQRLVRSAAWNLVRQAKGTRMIVSNAFPRHESCPLGGQMTIIIASIRQFKAIRTIDGSKVRVHAGCS